MLAPLVALGAPSRPSLYLESAPADRPRATKQDIADKGAVIVWPATDTQGRPPPDIQRQFPDLVAEVPRAFARQHQGRMPLMRVGWGMIRPHVEANPPAPPPPPVSREPQPLPQPAPPPEPQSRPQPQSQPSEIRRPEQAQPQPPPPPSPPPQRRRQPRVINPQQLHQPQ
jgi:hypothetical protein